MPDIGAVTVFLSHLSANNNTPELALSTFNQFITQRNDLKVEVMLASRQKKAASLRCDPLFYLGRSIPLTICERIRRGRIM